MSDLDSIQTYPILEVATPDNTADVIGLINLRLKHNDLKSAPSDNRHNAFPRDHKHNDPDHQHNAPRVETMTNRHRFKSGQSEVSEASTVIEVAGHLDDDDDMPAHFAPSFTPPPENTRTSRYFRDSGSPKDSPDPDRKTSESDALLGRPRSQGAAQREAVGALEDLKLQQEKERASGHLPRSISVACEDVNRDLKIPAPGTSLLAPRRRSNSEGPLLVRQSAADTQI